MTKGTFAPRTSCAVKSVKKVRVVVRPVKKQSRTIGATRA